MINWRFNRRLAAGKQAEQCQQQKAAGNFVRGRVSPVAFQGFARLFVAQSYGRFNARRPASGNVASGERNASE